MEENVSGCFFLNTVYSQFAPVTNSPHVNMARGGIQRYQPNFWRLTRDSTE